MRNIVSNVFLIFTVSFNLELFASDNCEEIPATKGFTVTSGTPPTTTTITIQCTEMGGNLYIGGTPGIIEAEDYCRDYRNKKSRCIEREKRLDKKENAEKCESAIKELQTSKKDAIEKCKDAKVGSISECSAQLNKCDESSEDTDIIFPYLNLDVGYTGCSDYSTSDYRSELSDAKQQIKDSQKSLTEAMKDMAEKQDKSKEKKQELYESYNSLMDELEEIKADQKKSKAETDAQIREAEAKAKIEVRKIEQEIFNVQTTMKQRIAGRSVQLEEFKINIANCPDEARKVIDNLPQFKPRPKSNMNMKDINTRNQDKKGRYQDALVACRNKLMLENKIGSQALRDTLTALEMQIADLEQRKQDLLGEIQEIKKQKAQAEVDRIEAEKKLAEKSQRKIGLLQQQAMQNDQSEKRDLQIAQQEISKLQQEIQTANRELTTIQSQDPKRMTQRSALNEAAASTSEFRSKLLNCKAVCGKVSSEEEERCIKQSGLGSKTDKFVDQTDGASGIDD